MSERNTKNQALSTASKLSSRFASVKSFDQLKRSGSRSKEKEIFKEARPAQSYSSLQQKQPELQKPAIRPASEPIPELRGHAARAAIIAKAVVAVVAVVAVEKPQPQYESKAHSARRAFEASKTAGNTVKKDPPRGTQLSPAQIAARRQQEREETFSALKSTDLESKAKATFKESQSTSFKPRR